ncbi:MAG: repeat-containing protein [Planctomycetota bacterium]|nr:repeat-containing protein [Planctomycetota bacterium]
MTRPIRMALLFMLVATTARGAADPVRAPKVWAIVVGIDTYEDAAIPECKGAAADARAIRTWLVENAGWEPTQVVLMDPTAPRNHGLVAQQITALRPTRENLAWLFQEWLPFRLKPGDVVLFSFSGQAIGGKEGDAALDDRLLPVDADSKRLDVTGWRLPQALDKIASRGENPILIWLDTSLSGRGRPAGNLTGRQTSSSHLLGELTRWPGVAAWIAADGHPVAEPAGERERGAFTNAVLSAMGTPESPRNLLGGLFTASRDERLVAQGFRAAGGLGPELSLWPKMLAAAIPPPSELLLQRGHADRVMALAFSADGATMVSASMDSTLKVWRVSDRVLLRTLPSHLIGVSALALSPDSTMLVSADGAGRVILWTLSDLMPHRFAGLPPHRAGVVKLEFLQNGSGFASIDLDGKAVLWKVDGKSLTPIPLTDSATSLAAGENIVAIAAPPRDDLKTIRIYSRDGELLRSFDGPGGLITGNGMAIRGNLLAAGNKDGLVGIWSLTKNEEIQRFVARESIESVVLTDRAALAGSGTTVWCVWKARGLPPTPISLDGKIAQIATSGDGYSAAACSATGKITAWSMPEKGGVSTVPITTRPDSPLATAVAFPPHGNTLVSGDQDGGMRAWEWSSGALQSRIKPHRGKIDAMAISRDGRFLIQIDHDRKARIWDLFEGRGLRSIPGEWESASFLPDGKSLAMTRRDGTLVLVDSASLTEKATTFDRPNGANGRPLQRDFKPLAVSLDGRWIAAGSTQGPIACLWPVGGGPPTRTIVDHDEPISAVAFADDSKHWLTASLDGKAKIWGPAGEKPRWTLDIGNEDEPEPDPAVTAARIAPGALGRAVTGHRDGRLILWTLRDGQAPIPILLGRFEGDVHAIVFTPDGKHLLAAGQDKTVRLWDLSGPIPPPSGRKLEPQHSEQVNALVAFPNAQLLASAGDDTTVRFWKTDGASLVGTLASSTEDGTWVAFDQDGRFDSAPGGEVQVSYLQDGRVLSLDQFTESGRVFGLARNWIAGKAPEGISPFRGPRPAGLAIDPPDKPAVDGEVELTVHLGDAGLENLRLYQNDIPVRDASDFRATPDPTARKVSVLIGSGENRFVAMASRAEPGAVHGRSNVVAIRGPGPADAVQGVIHILAIGISAYSSNPLKFAGKDAVDFADFLGRNGVKAGEQGGLKIVLPDAKATPEKVEEALMAILRKAKPEDSVVVFLAGHTDIVGRDRFCLLLSNFPFAANEISPGQRGPLNPISDAEKVRATATAVLPYSSIYRLLTRMNARNRLVVIDACQAEAVFDDQGVRRIQDKVDDGSHRARTSYLLASRRGEAASESAVLGHGLLTHLLLRGMGSTDLKPEPGQRLGHADADGSGIVTTEELRQYIDTNLPILTASVSLTGPRANPNPASGAVQTKADSPRARGATTIFPLAKLPKGK